MEYTEKEKEILSIMFQHMYEWLRLFEPYGVFDASDLAKLAEKIGIDY